MNELCDIGYSMAGEALRAVIELSGRLLMNFPAEVDKLPMRNNRGFSTIYCTSCRWIKWLPR